MHRTLIRTAMIAALAVLAAFAGCSSDDPAAPDPPGSPSFTLPAGVYHTTSSITTCSGDEVQSSRGTRIWCSSEVIDELPGRLLCTPTMVNPDSLTINCSSTETEGTCTVSWTAMGTGSRNRTTGVWTLTAHVEITNQTPPACFNSFACFDLVLSVWMIEPVPAGCAFADLNKFEATVSGGPMDGLIPLNLWSEAVPVPGGVRWNVFGQYPDAAPGVRSTGEELEQNWTFAVYLEPIDPKSLPRTIQVSVPTGANASAGVDNSVIYSEYDNQGYSFLPVGGGGTVTVDTMDDNHIAGTIDLTIMGEPFQGPLTAAQEPTPRDVDGGFFVLRRWPPPPPPSLASKIGEQLLNSLRWSVE